MLQTRSRIGPFPTAVRLQGASVPETVQVRIEHKAILGPDNPKAWTIVLNQSTENLIEKTIEETRASMEGLNVRDAAKVLYQRLQDIMPVLKSDPYNGHPFVQSDVEIDAGEHGVGHSEEQPARNVAISDHEATFWHTHDPEIGPAADYHSHDIQIQFVIASNDNNPSKPVLLSKEMKTRLQAVVESYYNPEKDFSGVTMELSGERLFNAVTDAIPELRDGVGGASEHLDAVKVTINFDGSLDHPNYPMEVIRSLG